MALTKVQSGVMDGGLNLSASAPDNTLVTTSAGNVGIGTASPATRLEVRTTGTAPLIRVTTNADSSGSAQGGLQWFETNSSAISASITGIRGGGSFNQTNLAFSTADGGANTERMRITSGGDLLIGATDDTDQRVRITNNGTTPSWGLKMHNTATSGDNKFIEFGTQAGFTARGSITYNRGAGTVAYNTTSDSRLKDNIEVASSALSKINSVQIRSYDWKETGNHVDFGVIAQELIQVAPEAVTEGTDNEDGTIKSPWAVDTAALVPAMIKAIQEQQAIITDLKARIETLEAK